MLEWYRHDFRKYKTGKATKLAELNTVQLHAPYCGRCIPLHILLTKQGVTTNHCLSAILPKWKLSSFLHKETNPQSSQLHEPLWTDPGLKSGISVGELISTIYNNNKKCRWGMISWTFSQNPCVHRKSQERQPSARFVFFFNFYQNTLFNCNTSGKPCT